MNGLGRFNGVEQRGWKEQNQTECDRFTSYGVHTCAANFTTQIGKHHWSVVGK